MFILFISNSKALIEKIERSNLLSGTGTKAFYSLLTPPNRDIGIPLKDPFGVLDCFTFSDKLLLPKSTPIVYLHDIECDENQTDALSLLPLTHIEDMYRDAFSQLLTFSAQSSSQYLREVKSIKDSIAENLKQSIAGESIGNCCNIELWSKYCEARNYPFKVLNFNTNDINSCNTRLDSLLTEFNKMYDDKAKKLVIRPTSSETSSPEFTMPYSSMGFGDFFQRLERLYDFVKSFTDFKYIVEPYTNPHSTELDFNSLVNISGDKSFQEASDELMMEIFDFYSYILSPCYIDRFVKFNLIMGPGRQVLNKLSNIVNIEQTFIEKLSMNIPQCDYQAFQDKNSLKVVYHMRRHDTCLGRFSDVLPANVRKRLGVERPLLDFSTCDTILRSYLDKRANVPNIEVTIISDGVDDLLNKYEQLDTALDIDDSAIQERFSELKVELEKGMTKVAGSRVTGRIIGRGSKETIESVIAISESDFVITSSGFSIFIARIVGADFLNGFQALPLITKGHFDFSKIIVQGRS